MGKIIVVGSGFSGSVIAREIATKLNKRVVVVEKRKHIGGNMYDKVEEHGIRIHMYGPHVIVTDRWNILKYLMQFSEFYKYVVKELSFIDGRYVRLPFNFESAQELIGEEKSEILINKLRKKFRGEERVPVLRLANDEDQDISNFGNLLFEKAYRTYCAKQWDVPVDKLDKTIMDRVPMAMSYDERYMRRDFQFLPKNGYNELFKKEHLTDTDFDIQDCSITRDITSRMLVMSIPPILTEENERIMANVLIELKNRNIIE